MDIGLIHFVCFDTEVYSYYPDKGQIQRQLNWLKADLIKANKRRNVTPWIVSLAHKAFFMEETNFTAFSPLLHKYGVDLHLCGHAHNYQRLYPTYHGEVEPQSQYIYINPSYMTTIVAGSAGSKEKLSGGKAPSKTLANYIKDYGYGHLQAVNRTHLHWQWENTHHSNGSVFQDHLWIVQENHGMRDEPSQVSREDANDQTKDKGIDIHY
ncbi:PREDICTED: acid phosphatase type 7-like isoform X2 [Acropora digitifera]|uniref:acid phosphatase type 7-like isoform X2 n=1 Tax=Acropora digitifera TaxID=70779 RepID=UPI00077A5C00|nr:PREDICTED: acid phosphatase type 7-like isoform X2 [Acropora digitifera]